MSAPRSTSAHRLRQIEMCALAKRVYASIGAAGTMDREMLAAEAVIAVFERFLHREAVRLALPADEPRAVIFDRQLVAGHGSTVPAAIG